MTAKEYLGQAYKLDQRINSKLEQVELLNTLATRVTTTISGMPRNPNHATSLMTDAVEKIIDLQAEINNDIDHLVDLKREIFRIIKAVQISEYQMVLELRYLCFKTWEHIAVEMGFNVRHVYRIHDAAIGQIFIEDSLQ